MLLLLVIDESSSSMILASSRVNKIRMNILTRHLKISPRLNCIHQDSIRWFAVLVPYR